MGLDVNVSGTPIGLANSFLTQDLPSFCHAADKAVTRGWVATVGGYVFSERTPLVMVRFAALTELIADDLFVSDYWRDRDLLQHDVETNP